MYYLRYINFITILIAITLYSYFLILDYKDELFVTRTFEKNMWIIICYIFLFIILYLIRYKYNKNE